MSAQITVTFPDDFSDYFPLTAVALVCPAALLAVLASCHESSDAFDNLESNSSTSHISHKYTVSLQCELADEP